MKNFVLFTLFVALLAMDVTAQEYKIVTSVESIVPMGIGRSRIINHAESVDAAQFTTERKEGTDSDQKNIKRKRLKIDELEETKLLNFFSIAGINFQNIASNDAVISSRLTDLAAQGWELVFVTSGVESDGGETDGNGIFITRYIFKR
ncbi:MAG: hypothetical protein OEQ53_11875 [Saprospiraceae bacterium]|nr:hypothetical protein [Saprospiraceae bacterium]